MGTRDGHCGRDIRDFFFKGVMFTALQKGNSMQVGRFRDSHSL